MSYYHKTKKGDSMSISQMSDTHLTNTIKLYCRNLLKARLDADLNKTVELVNALPFYVIEATLRGINIKNSLIEAFGRSSQGVSTIELTESVDEEDMIDGYDNR